MQLNQVGEFESSKSAMNTFAPELSALITILRSTGPVISTRRSAISSGVGATRQSPARTSAVSGRKSGSSPAWRRSRRAARRREQLDRGVRRTRAARSARNVLASGVRTSAVSIIAAIIAVRLAASRRVPRRRGRRVASEKTSGGRILITLTPRARGADENAAAAQAVRDRPADRRPVPASRSRARRRRRAPARARP